MSNHNRFLNKTLKDWEFYTIIFSSETAKEIFHKELEKDEEKATCVFDCTMRLRSFVSKSNLLYRRTITSIITLFLNYSIQDKRVEDQPR